MKNYRMHILSHTHWDREWYQPFQQFRMRLVYLIDELLNILETQPDYKCFHLDGQTCCLEDYLEIRPENKERLKKQIKLGRILIGPWYVMPDEFLVSGESLIRNLQLGFSICKEFETEPTPVGYVTDIFGHASQFPQILKGFNINDALLHRGTRCDEDEKTEMLWEGADGSRVLIIKVFNLNNYTETCVRLNAICENAEEVLKCENNKIKISTTPVLFVLEGGDHNPVFSDEQFFIDKLNSYLRNSQAFHSSFKDYIADLHSNLHEETLRILKGELRTPAHIGNCIDVFFGTGSARFDLKYQNDNCEYLLTRIAEPLNAWAWLLGGDDNTAFLKLAWKYLLLNHPHDSIVGCSADQVHKDMHYRFDQCRIIALSCATESARKIAEQISITSDTMAVTVFNLANTHRNISHIELEIPISDLEKYESSVDPVFTNSDGDIFLGVITTIVKSKRTDFFMKKTTCLGESKHYSPDYSRTNGTIDPAIAHIYIDVDLDMEPFSYETFNVTLKEKKPENINSDSHIENEFIRLCSNDDGTFNLIDKITSKHFRNIGQLEDCGDCGNGWDHMYPKNDKVFLSGKGAYDIQTSYEIGEIKSSMQISYKWDIPSSLDETRENRSDELTTVNVKNIFSLVKGKKYVECHTEIINTAIQHRIRVLCPTNIDADLVAFDTPFDIVKVPIKLLDTTGSIEQSREEHPMKNLVHIKDDTSGLGIITKGLCEGFAIDNDCRTIGITLFRSFTYPLYALPTQDSKHLDTLSFQYSFAVTADEKELWNITEDYKTPLLAFSHIAPPTEISMPIPPKGSLLNIGELVLSSLTLKGKDIEVRTFNPFETSISNTISHNFKYDIAKAVNFLGEEVEPASIISPKKISTIKYINCKKIV
jgi:mannosylglycerate hydrolase